MAPHNKGSPRPQRYIAAAVAIPTPAFMAEKWEDILRWEAAGHSGVEMELATTFAVAAHFGVPSAGLIYLLDNLIAERHILHNTEEDHRRIAESRRLIEEVALEIAAAL